MSTPVPPIIPMPPWFAYTLKWAMLEDQRAALLKALRTEQLNQSNAQYRMMGAMERYKFSTAKVNLLRRALRRVENEQAAEQGPPKMPPARTSNTQRPETGHPMLCGCADCM
jgi:hypothetical protein